MALVALEIPKIGLVMENARLVRWLKDVGDVVHQGEPLLELETEKSVVEIECTESGRLVELLLHADQEARVGDRIAWLENGIAAAPGQSAPEANREDNAERIKSSPVARRLAAQHAVDLRGITGTGPRGRVQLIDVQRALESPAADAPVASAAPSVQSLSSMRRALARSMTLSNATVPQFAVERAVDWTTLKTLRAKLGAELPADTPRPSVNDFLLQGIAGALHRFPALNVTFAGDANSPDAGVVAAQGVHIGLVVAVDQGLLVPVFHGVERLGLEELARRRRDVVQRALQGKLKREELDGATFSLSNLGKDGPDRFNALINPPQSAILAVGRQRDCVVARNGSIHVRPMSQLTLTVDHRVADGRLASDFLACLVDILEGDVWQLH
ncbi:MAG TPA: dihydrolipoamide acetyltransferase family protein [Steroidobacteraceae bacterium]|nr:dihydrolipoamide acetyltransferase family protein [Steroidobacteraceae bacterium]